MAKSEEGANIGNTVSTHTFTLVTVAPDRRRPAPRLDFSEDQWHIEFFAGGKQLKIAILDGSPEAGLLSSFISELETSLSSREDIIEILTLRELNLKYCTGCWSCWWGPTCGECVLKDETSQILTAVINSDLVIMASPVIMGFISALLKKAQDKLPALLLPYIRIIDGECRHLKRYEKYPQWGLLLEKSADTDDEDIEIIRSIQGHAANNLRSELCFNAFVTDSVKEVADEISSL